MGGGKPGRGMAARRGASYTLSEEQYEELRNALERAGEPFSEIMGNEIDGYRLMAE